VGSSLKPGPAIRNTSLWLWLLFSLACFSLGYATLNRYDPAQTRGVGDSQHYFRMAEFEYSGIASPYRFRILTPTLAGSLIPLLSKLPHHSWNITSLAFLLINSLFVSFSAMMLFQLTTQAGGSGPTALIASFLYLTCFPVPNGHLAGLVDAAEGFALLALLRALSHSNTTHCVGILALSATAKESALLFCSVILIVWWVASRKTARSDGGISLPWVLASITAGILALWLVRHGIGGSPYSAHQFSTARLFGLGEGLMLSLKSRSTLYTFLFLLPAGLYGLKALPRPLLAASATAGLVAYLAGSYANITENVARLLFNTVGPALCIASAFFLSRLVRGQPKAFTD
jgi:hypothetical protein